ncbi:efflux RND transporter periplasmic adaptor subunit [Prosthecochloris sp. SCSIO W1103]|uniref:efflux RND transporter periplasmic adaptor subunit n=1 Tax=Prosthecochloris sp. SCSIO W1103 TaxID=2992244 RepID=UPI00223C911C|nr:efflux RND transporter periplasmic adaptor subunit [Prosthecochloris sp. SCSIO W1103]UZJ38742.1 efflux RND transporter periplasmic adaptor subunit [Prosthecochloris sp. SCSIO W1103]
MSFCKRHTWQKKKRLWGFLVVVAVCGFLVVVALSSKPPEKSAAGKADTKERGMPVSVERIEPGTYSAVITVFGEVVPLCEATVKTQVEGQIVFFSEKLYAGSTVTRGELLLQVEKSNYDMAVAEAKNRLAAAKVNLLTAQGEAREAKKNWQRSGIKGEPASPLVFREPQLKAARAELDAARSALVHAERLLADTEIRAPFDAVVMQRNVNPGESLFAGDEVATLFGMETVEVSVRLNPDQWALLPESIFGTEVVLKDSYQHAEWRAEVVRDSRRLVRESRMRTIFMQVNKPFEQRSPLLPGAFVRVELIGKDIPDLLRIPEASLTKEGFVWFVDKDNRLQARKPEPVFYGQGEIYVSVPKNMEGPLRVVVSPNSSFVSGLAVRPI